MESPEFTKRLIWDLGSALRTPLFTMHSISRLVALATTISPAMAVYQGFNYGSTFNDGTPKQQGHFEDEFNTAHGLVGAPGAGFTSARLYTMIVSYC